MAIGRIYTRILFDIANAIREQNGTEKLIKPIDFAKEVRALNGIKSGSGYKMPFHGESHGYLQPTVFEDLANAIREQNGETVRYKPGDMAAAILALSWANPESPRAVLFEDGCLWLGRFDSVPKNHGTSKGSWPVQTGGYESYRDRPWYGVRKSMKYVVIDATFKRTGVTSIRNLFEAMYAVERIYGFENLSEITDFTSAFSGCNSLESIFATTFDSSKILSASGAFNGCYRLVGERGYAASSTDGIAVLNYGDKGVLCHSEENDPRFWVWGALYEDGSVEIGNDEPIEGARKITEKRRICAQARYTTGSALPWGLGARNVKSVTIAQLTMPADLVWNTDYWFYGCYNATSMSGLGNLRRVGSMRYTFYNCQMMQKLDLRGLASAYLASLFYTFNTCPMLETITVDRNWALPSGISWASVPGSQTFGGCSKLVGGAGTAWSSSKVTGAMAVIDTAAVHGYLTAG